MGSLQKKRRSCVFHRASHVDEKIENPEVAHGCASCHALARPLSWHRTPDDWIYLKNMHLAFFPAVRFTAFDPPGDAETPGPPKGPTPCGAALAYIVKSSPLHTLNGLRGSRPCRPPGSRGAGWFPAINRAEAASSAR